MSKPAPAHRRTANPLASLLTYLVEVEQAVANRNWTQLAGLLRKRTSSHLPCEVREELLMLSRAPRASLRAPMKFLRFQHRMSQLAIGNEPLPTAQTQLRLDSPVSGSRIRRIDDAVRGAAARDAGVDEKHGDGSK